MPPVLLTDERGHELSGLDVAGRVEGQAASDKAAGKEHGAIQLHVPLDATRFLVPGEGRGLGSDVRHVF